MKSLHIVQLFNSTSAPKRSADLGEGAPKRQWDTDRLGNADFSVEEIAAFDWPLNPAARMHNAYLGLDPLRAIRVLLTRRKATIICAHMESAVVLLLLRRLFRFKPLIVIWEVPWSPGWRFRQFVSRLAIPRADHAVVFSSNQIGLIHNSYGQEVAASFVPFCVDTEFYRPQPAPTNVMPYVLSCGLDAGRDFDVVMRASAGVGAPFLIKTSHHPCPDRARFPNVTVSSEYLTYPQYRDMFAGASVVIVATQDTPNASGVTTLMEAMAMGKPTIVSDNPALRDYLPPPGAGIVVPIGDSAALRTAIISILQDPELAGRMGREARAFAERRFSPERHFRVAANLFWTLANGAPPRPRQS